MMMDTSDGNTILGELVLIKDEDIQIKEEELDIKHEATIFNEMEGMYSQGRKRSLSPSFSHEMAPGSKRQLPNVEEIKSENEQIMNCFDLYTEPCTTFTQHSCSVFPTLPSSTMASKGKATASKPRKLKILSMSDKLNVIEDHEQGVSRAQLMIRYDLKKSTLHDIIKSKEKIKEVMKKVDHGSKGKDLYRVRKAQHDNLDEAAYKWYLQKRAEGATVSGLDIQHATGRLAKALGIEKFECSSGWLWRFRKRHSIGKCTVPVDVGVVAPFVDQLLLLREEEHLHEFQIYNAAETGLYWCTVPHNTQAFQDLTNIPGHKSIKDRLSILVCTNADGSHKLQPVIVGKSRRPRALKNIMTKLPVEYHGTPSAWFNQQIVEQWFHNRFDPAVRQHQAHYGIAPEDVKALLLLDNSPAHPSAARLCSKDGRIKAFFLPPNSTSLIQPMDLGILESAKRHYRTLFLQRCLVVTEDGMDEPDYINMRGKKTTENFRSYNIKDAIFNWVEAWKQVPLAVIKNAWCKLLKMPKPPALGHAEFEGFNIPKMINMLAQAGQGQIPEEEVTEWLEEDFGMPGYYHHVGEESTDHVQSTKTPVEKEEEKHEEEKEEKQRGRADPSLAAGVEACDTLLNLIDNVGSPITDHYEMLRAMRMQLLQLQQERKVQL